MNTYKFQATIPTNGVLQIPQPYPFPNQEVEIVIRPKNRSKTHQEKAKAIDLFISEWSGILKGQTSGESKRRGNPFRPRPCHTS